MRNDEADAAAAHFTEEGRHLPNGSKFEIDKRRLFEKSEKQNAPRREGKPTAASLGRMAGRKDKRSPQARERAGDFP